MLKVGKRKYPMYNFWLLMDDGELLGYVSKEELEKAINSLDTEFYESRDVTVIEGECLGIEKS